MLHLFNLPPSSTRLWTDLCLAINCLCTVDSDWSARMSLRIEWNKLYWKVEMHCKPQASVSFQVNPKGSNEEKKKGRKKYISLDFVKLISWFPTLWLVSLRWENKKPPKVCMLLWWGNCRYFRDQTWPVRRASGSHIDQSPPCLKCTSCNPFLLPTSLLPVSTKNSPEPTLMPLLPSPTPLHSSPPPPPQASCYQLLHPGLWETLDRGRGVLLWGEASSGSGSKYWASLALAPCALRWHPSASPVCRMLL